MADHPWLGPVVGTRLAVVVRRDPLETCETCDGNGVYLDEESEYDCPCAEDSYRDPTPADLLTDPRVRALVEALDAVMGDLYDHAADHYDAAKAALAPFEVARARALASAGLCRVVLLDLVDGALVGRAP